MNRNALYASAGLQAGISGALGLLFWIAIASRFLGRSVWWAFNLLASAFYGESSLRYGFGRYTLAGAALVLFVYGVLGIFFGLFWRERSGGVTILVATLALSMLSFYILLKWAWREASPEGALYAPDRQIFLGHILFGFLLARYPRFRDRVRDST